MRARARPLFLRTVFQILFRISQSNGKNENPKTDISALKSVFGFRVRLQIRNPDFQNLNPYFPIERTLKCLKRHYSTVRSMKNVAVLTEDGAFALFFCPLPGAFDSSRVPTPGNLPSKAKKKKMLLPGGQPGGQPGGGGLVAAGID